MPRLKATPKCPQCSKTLDGYQGLKENTEPAEDDITVCAYCSQVLQFNADLSLRPAGIEAIASALLELSQAQQIVKQFQELSPETLDQMNSPPDA